MWRSVLGNIPHHHVSKNQPVCKHFKLLGSTTAAVLEPLLIHLRRLRTASHNRCVKRKLVRSLVLPLFNHTGAWSMLSVNHLFKWKKMIELAVLGCRPGLFVLDPTLFFIFCLIQQQLTMCTTSDQVSQLGLGDIPILPPRCLSGNGKTLRFLIFVPLLVISAFFSIGNTPCVKLRVLVGTWFFLTKSPESSKMLLICNLKSLC